MKLPHRRQFFRFAAGAAALPAVVAHRAGASLSVPAGARHCGFSGGRHERHPRAPDCRVALQPIRPLVHRREPAGSGREHRARIRRSGGAARLHAQRLRLDRIAQRDPLQRPQVQFHARHDARRQPDAGNERVGRASGIFGALSPELIAATKANPDAITVASSGLGSTPHIFWELFRSMTGARMLHVPYRGGAQPLTDVLGQQVQVYFATIADAMEHIKAGRLRALAVTGATRTQALPDVPTIAEFVPGYEAIGWLWPSSPQRTRPPRSSKRSTRRSMPASPTPKSSRPLPTGGETVFASSPAEFATFIAAENAKWGIGHPSGEHQALARPNRGPR